MLRTTEDVKREKLLQEAVALAITEFGLIPLHHQVVTWAARSGLTDTLRADERAYAHHFVPK